MISWLPLYLVKQRGFSLAEMAQLGALVYCLFGISTMAFGWLSDRLIAAGHSINRVRKALVVLGHLGIAVCLVGTALGGPMLAVVSLLLCGVCFGTNTASVWAITQTLAGPRAAARWVGLQNGMANVAGILAPLVTGFVVDYTGSFNDAFLFAAAAALVGAAGWGLIIPRVSPVAWND